MRYKLSCTEWNQRHAKFNVFDRGGANCGQLCILAEDVINFVQNSWNGDIAWNGLMPSDVLDRIESLSKAATL